MKKNKQTLRNKLKIAMINKQVSAAMLHREGIVNNPEKLFLRIFLSDRFREVLARVFIFLGLDIAELEQDDIIVKKIKQKNLGDTLRMLRENKSLSREELTGKLGWKETRIRHIELHTGSTPTNSEIKQLVEFFDVDPDFLDFKNND